MAGFRSPLFILGISAVTAVTQSGFRTPIPPLNIGSVQAQEQAGFRTPIPVLNLGSVKDEKQAGFVTPIPVLRMGSVSAAIEETGVYRGYKSDLQKQLIREDEDILMIITAFMELNS